MKKSFWRSSLCVAIVCATTSSLSHASQVSQEIVSDSNNLLMDLPQNIAAVPNVDNFSTTYVPPANVEDSVIDETGMEQESLDAVEDIEMSGDVDEPPQRVNYTEDNWCQEKGPYDFAFVNDEFAGFHLKKGTLSGNIERFVALMYPESNGLISKVGRHLVAGDMCIVAKNPNQIMQLIIEPYFIGNVPVYFASFKNDFHALFYKDDEEFMRYRIGVRR